ncbi:Uncharacterised protein [Bordetella pertussis]|nr:Uncharacterised protein [Bordetella pertussis]CFP64244.1 Uncharacterised protein [Bordetella pertussis]
MPRPTPPHRYTPRGTSRRLSSFFRALERKALKRTHSS